MLVCTQKVTVSKTKVPSHPSESLAYHENKKKKNSNHTLWMASYFIKSKLDNITIAVL